MLPLLERAPFPKLSVADRVRMRTKAKEAQASEARNKKKHSSDLPSETPALSNSPMDKGKEVAPPAVPSKSPTAKNKKRGTSIQELSTSPQSPSSKRLKTSSDKSFSFKSFPLNHDLATAAEHGGVSFSLPAEASALKKQAWSIILPELCKLPTPIDRATFQSLPVKDNFESTMRHIFTVSLIQILIILKHLTSLLYTNIYFPCIGS